MGVLNIAQEAADRIGLPQVTQLIGSTDENARAMRSLIQASGEDLCLMQDPDGDGWAVLEREYEFVTEADETEYDLPEDFKSLTAETAWQKDKYWKLRGSLNGRQWQKIRNRQATISYNVFRIKRTLGAAGQQGRATAPIKLRKFTLEPAAGAGITMVYEYISTYWWVSQDGSEFKRRPTVDTDESLFGEEIHIRDLIWRFKASNGLVYASDLAQFEHYRDSLFFQDTPKEDIPIGYDYRTYANKTESDVAWCP